MTAKTSEAVDDRERGARQTGIAKSTGYDPLVLALVALTFSTGLIDAVSYIGLGHVFVAKMKVAIIERKRFGGTCVNNGCIPDQDADRQRSRSAYRAPLQRRRREVVEEH